MLFETERLIIRKAVPGDKEAIFEILSDPEVIKYNCYDPGTIEDVERYIEKTKDDDRRYVIEHKEDHRVMGELNLERDSLRYGVNSVMFSYQLNEAYRGQGYMSEALKGAIKHCFEVRKVDLVSARVFSDNEKSLQLLVRLGFKKEGTLRHAVKCSSGFVHDDNLFCMMKDEYLALYGAGK